MTTENTADKRDVQSYWAVADSISRELERTYGIRFIADGHSIEDCSYQCDGFESLHIKNQRVLDVWNWVVKVVPSHKFDYRHMCASLILAHTAMVDIYLELNRRY